MREGYLPILVFSGIVIGTGVLLLFISHIFGPKRRSPQKFEPYECGVDQIQSGRKKFHVKFYLIATLFILFDIETVFLIPWAVIFNSLNIYAIAEMLVFLFILAIGLLYVLKKKVIEWD